MDKCYIIIIKIIKLKEIWFNAITLQLKKLMVRLS